MLKWIQPRLKTSDIHSEFGRVVAVSDESGGVVVMDYTGETPGRAFGDAVQIAARHNATVWITWQGRYEIRINSKSDSGALVVKLRAAKAIGNDLVPIGP